jgi:hypothetical protein
MAQQARRERVDANKSRPIGQPAISLPSGAAFLQVFNSGTVVYGVVYFNGHSGAFANASDYRHDFEELIESLHAFWGRID